MHKKAYPSLKKDGSQNTGMDLRDFFAASALQGILAADDGSMEMGPLADKAYKIADSMIKKRHASRVKADVDF